MPPPFPIDDPPACGPTLAAVQAVLDGARPVADLDAGPHAAGCPACRARVAEARVLLTALALPAEPIVVPAGFAAGVLSAVRTDRRARTRRTRMVSIGAGLAVAATVLIAVWVANRPTGTPDVVQQTPGPKPIPTPRPEPAPPPRPVRVSAELAKAGDALRDSSRPLTDPAAAAPKVLATLAEAMIPSAAVPVNQDVTPVGATLADLPAAARTGLEPVTGTTQKAFNRLLRDVGLFQTSARPKS
ncbi:MAG TPA: hypothetical protein VH092_06045 [Urbifossiella sp.]|jgi:hypothetical protein|nr:hypothetical protein [Urbifossiella sp.]